MELFSKVFAKQEQAKSVDLLQQIQSHPLPVHIGIIMDGNGRWAQKRGMPRTFGHRAGMEAFKGAVKAAIKTGIKYLTVYAFSTENWKRPQEEVNALMNLLVEYIYKELDELASAGVRIKAIGRIGGLPEKARLEIERAERATSGNEILNLQIALNYGGRTELADTVKEICRQVSRQQLQWDAVDEKIISAHLYTAGIPDPDLIIRTSGEKRLSNFLIWQAAYAEFVVLDVLWPDFEADDLYRAIAEYQQRHRRFGGV